MNTETRKTKRFDRPILVYLDEPLHREALAAADREGLSFTALVRQLLKKYLSAQRKHLTE